MSARFDLSLYLVTDNALCGERGLQATVEAALAGGVSMLQYRAKDNELRTALAEAAMLAELARRHKVPFIVNDRLDVALAVGADGLHVGQSDMPSLIARRWLGPDKILGISVTREIEIATVDPAVVDYVGLGPVFATGTKSDAAVPLGLEKFHSLRQRIEMPVVAIGGIQREQASQVIAAGADGIAVVSAICAATDATAAARDLCRMIEAGRA
ncbi:MAG: thiamine phosphate synthase [Dongiaceae bacterium]